MVRPASSATVYQNRQIRNDKGEPILKTDLNVYPILLAGGSGTRLWPVSRELFPKQLVSFLGDEPLIQTTIKRLFPSFEPEKIRVVCGKDHSHEIVRDIEAIGIEAENKVINEPCGRNTAPAILLGLLEILKNLWAYFLRLRLPQSRLQQFQLMQQLLGYWLESPARQKII